VKSERVGPVLSRSVKDVGGRLVIPAPGVAVASVRVRFGRELRRRVGGGMVVVVWWWGNGRLEMVRVCLGRFGGEIDKISLSPDDCRDRVAGGRSMAGFGNLVDGNFCWRWFGGMFIGKLVFDVELWFGRRVDV